MAKRDHSSSSRFIDGEFFRARPPKSIRSKSAKKSFEAYKEEEGDSVTIVDCRMTITTPKGTSHGEEIKKQYGKDPDYPLDPQDEIMVLYVLGQEMQDSSDPSIITATGQCIFFVLSENDDHKPITKQNELVIKKSAFFYYKYSESEKNYDGKYCDDKYCRDTFEHITTVYKKPEVYIRSSSPRTNHQEEGINLYPPNRA